jgi:hypothetical protein
LTSRRSARSGSKAAALRLTLDEGQDPIDGSELNAVRRHVLELLSRTEDDMSDVELMARAPDSFWYIDMCLERLHRLPSEIDPLIGCREYTTLQAYALVKRAQEDMMCAWYEKK